ncbi:ROK family protein [Candidatus Saccharibacteria bacterium]|nr:ROK family protein [Candidatus Saccharibacteria bacterium]
MLVGIDIGGSKIHVASSHLGKKIEREHIFPTPTNQRTVGPTLIKAVREVCGRSPIDAIGISSPGPIDKRRGMVLTPSHIPWHNLRIVEPLRKAFGCPVAIENDANCGGMAEAKYGAGKPFKVFVYITISSGIGTAIMVKGQPLPTPHNSEGGRMIIEPSLEAVEGRIGTFESLCSGQAVVRRFGAIAAEIHDHDTASWEIIAHELALGFYNIITLVNPEALVLAGGFSLNHKKFIRHVKQNLHSMPLLYPPPKIVPAKHILNAPVLGALLLSTELIT